MREAFFYCAFLEREVIIMSTDRIINTTLSQMIVNMQLDINKSELAMVDVETGRLNKMVFDFAYGFVNPVMGFQSNPEGNIIYEAIANPQLIEEIKEWDKIRKHGYAGGVYEFYKLLKDNNWWDQFLLTPQEIDLEMATVFTQKAQEHLYEIQSIVGRLAEVMATHKRKSTWKDTNSPTRKHYENRRIEMKQGQDAYIALKRILEKEENLANLVKSGALAENTTIARIQSDIIKGMYKDQLQNMNWELRWEQDMQTEIFRNLKYPIKTWKNTMEGFSKGLKKHSSSLLGITGYGVSSDQAAISRTSALYTPGTDYGELFDTYGSVCMNNMLGLLDKVDREALLSGLSKYDEKGLNKMLEDAFKNIGTLNTMKFNFRYENVFNCENYEQPHTAKGDVWDQSKALIEYFAKYVVPYLEGRK